MSERGRVLPERFLEKIDAGPGGGCWLWLSGKYPSGYGRFYWDRRQGAAHRFAYETLVGPIPAGLETDHLCRNRGCVNPSHLEPVTHLENVRRGDGGSAGGRATAKYRRARTHCPRGHPYAGSNLMVSNRGKRLCRTCKRAWDNARYARKRARRLAPDPKEETP